MSVRKCACAGIGVSCCSSPSLFLSLLQWTTWDMATSRLLIPRTLGQKWKKLIYTLWPLFSSLSFSMPRFGKGVNLKPVGVLFINNPCPKEGLSKCYCLLGVKTLAFQFSCQNIRACGQWRCMMYLPPLKCRRESKCLEMAEPQHATQPWEAIRAKKQTAGVPQSRGQRPSWWDDLLRLVRIGGIIFCVGIHHLATTCS